MNFTAKQIANQINGTIVGDPDVNILAISKIEEGSKGCGDRGHHHLAPAPPLLRISSYLPDQDAAGEGVTPDGAHLVQLYTPGLRSLAR